MNQQPKRESSKVAAVALHRPPWLRIVRRSGQEFIWDHCTDLAAVLTYHALLSIFPALLAIVGLLGVIGQAKATTTALLNIVRSVAPASAVALLQEPIEQLIDSPSAGLAVLIGVLAALWSASGYVRAFSRAMNRVYRVEEGRPFWVVAPVMLAVTVALLIAIAIIGVLLVVSGPIAKALGSVVGLGPASVFAWSIIRWPVLVALGAAILAVLYYVTPNVIPPKLRWISIGAVIALASMGLASAGFAFYIGNFSHYNKTYGAIGGVVVLVLWIWILNLAILFGAEIDTETERHRELNAGLPAERTLQLPLRDDRAILKRAQSQAATIEAGERVRELASHQRTDTPIRPDSVPLFRTKTVSDGASATFVLLHGLGLSHLSLGRLAEHLTPYGNVFAPDLPGFGTARKPRARLSVEDYATAIEDALDQRGLSSSGRLVILGHSLGAQIALEMALRRPDRVTAVILVGTVVDPAAPTLPGQAGRLLRDYFGEPPRTLLMVARAYLHGGFRQFLAGTRSMLEYSTADRIDQLTIPTLILRGGNDPISPAGWNGWLGSQVAQSCHRSILGHRHNVVHSAPDRVATVIMRFLDKLQTEDAAG
jgi:membrane protein